MDLAMKSEQPNQNVTAPGYIMLSDYAIVETNYTSMPIQGKKITTYKVG